MIFGNWPFFLRFVLKKNCFHEIYNSEVIGESYRKAGNRAIRNEGSWSFAK